MKTFYKLFVLFFIATAFTFCNSRKSAEYTTDAMEMSEMRLDKNKSAPALKEDQTQEYDRKLTKTGTLRFETSDRKKTGALIAKSVEEMKGFISNDNTSQYDGRVENTLTIRVPAQNFDPLMEKISSSASKIDEKSIEIEDVTQQYIDLDKRLKTKKELEARYLQLLQKATKVEEILKIEEQIGKLREDIESSEGQFRYLNNQINLSTLTVTFYEKNAGYGFWHKLGQGFASGWDNVLWLFVALANLWAIILFVVAIGFLIRYWRRRRKNRRLEK